MKFKVLFGEGACQAGSLHEDLSGAFARFIGLVAGKIHEINRARTGEEVEGGEEDKERRANDDRDEVEAEMVPEIMEVLNGEG